MGRTSIWRPDRNCLGLANSNRTRWVLEADIKGCFDHINHEWLENHVPMDREILRKWLK